jgi:hypothetical protein
MLTPSWEQWTKLTNEPIIPHIFASKWGYLKRRLQAHDGTTQKRRGTNVCTGDIQSRWVEMNFNSKKQVYKLERSQLAFTAKTWYLMWVLITIDSCWDKKIIEGLWSVVTFTRIAIAHPHHQDVSSRREESWTIMTWLLFARQIQYTHKTST